MIALFVLIFLAGTQMALGEELTSIDQRAAWAALDRSLQDGGADHRQQALAALSTMGEMEDAVKRAENSLKDKDVMVRQSAALALGEMKSPAAIPCLKEALDDDSPMVAFAAAKALSSLGDRSGEHMLVEVLAGERKDSDGIMSNAMRKAKDKLHHPQELVLMGAQDAKQ